MTTRIQHRVLKAVETLTVDGLAPSLEEIADHVGLATKSSVHRVVALLIAQGLMRNERPGCRGGLVIVYPEGPTDLELQRMSNEGLAGLAARVAAVQNQRTMRLAA